MSRCFPYPPPGYTKDGPCGEALIDSIKLLREKEKAKTERKKDKKREKKDKKREKKERKEKPSINYPKEGKRLNDSSKGTDAFDGCLLQKSTGVEVEQLEKSSITEDHEQHGCLQIPSESSDSTHNSHKRKREASPLKSCSNRGNIIRIRLPLQRHNDSEPRVDKEQICSTSGRTESPAQPKVLTTKQLGSVRSSTGTVSQNLVDRIKREPRVGKEQICSTSGRTESPAQPKVLTTKQLGSVRSSTGTASQKLVDRTTREPRVGKEQICSTSGRTESLAQQKVSTAKQLGSIRPSTATVSQNLIDRTKREPRVGKEQICSTSGRTESLAQQKVSSTNQLGSICPSTGTVTQNLIDRTKREPSGTMSAKTMNFGRGGAKPASVSKFQNGMHRVESTAQPMVAITKQLASIPTIATHPSTRAVNQNLLDRNKELSCPMSGKAGNFGGCSTEAASVSKLQAGVSRVESPAQPLVEPTKQLGSIPTITSAVGHDLIHRPMKELSCPTPAQTGNFGHGCAKAAAVAKSENKMQRVESLYQSLTQNWFPVPPQTQQAGFSDLEWLLGTEQQHDGEKGAKRCKTAVDNDGLCYGNPPTLCPRARLLPEADVYALPFTVPF